MDDHKKKQQVFYDKVYDNSNANKGKADIKDYFIENFLNGVINGNNPRVLEIGCGNGVLSERLLARKVSLLGVDISEKAIVKMGEKFSEEVASGQLSLACSDVVDLLSGSDQKFDVIIGSGIIHHIEKDSWGEFFGSICEHLSDGGVFACAPEPNSGGLYSLAWRMASFFYNKIYKIDYDDEVEKGALDMKPKKLRKALIDAGMTEAKIEAFQVIPHFSSRLLARLDRFLIKVIPGKFCLYIVVKGAKN